MAIAYFIPDQAKLLAASANATSSSSSQTHPNNLNGTNNHTTNNNNNTASSQSHTQSPTDGTAGGGGGGGGGGGHTHHHHTNGSANHNNHFRANITIPLSAYSATAAHSDVGCWDLLTQIFCHALRFCHQTERHPSVIQISLEINGSGPNGDATVQVGAAPVSMHDGQHQQARASGREEARDSHSVTPSLIVYPRSPNAAETQNNLTTAGSSTSSERPITAAPLTASSETLASATTGSSRDLEPGTHKPLAKRN